MTPLVVVDADVLGRQRTGDETYVENLLRRLPASAGDDFRFAAITRRPDLVPDGVEPVELKARFQELRMAAAVPRLLRRLRPALAHFQHALPLRCPCPAVVTVHDLSFEFDANTMGSLDRWIFKRVVPRAARQARRVIAVSERTKHDLVTLYAIPPERIAVIPHGVDSAFCPGANGGHDYLLYVGAIQARKDPIAAAEAARTVGLPLVVAGPEREPALARELERYGADSRQHAREPPAKADCLGDRATLVKEREGTVEVSLGARDLRERGQRLCLALPKSNAAMAGQALLGEGSCAGEVASKPGHVRKPVQQDGDTLFVAELARDREGLLPALDREIDLAEHVLHATLDAQCAHE